MPELRNKRIMVTATMSAGKSTLINAIIGKEIMPTSNSACTNNVVTIEESNDPDNVISMKLRNNRARLKNFKPEMLLKTGSDLLDIYTKMKHYKDKFSWTIIDTPGVNYSRDDSHREITNDYLSEGKFDILIVVLNGNNLGTNDERSYLEVIKKRVSDSKIIFVINKLDQFRRSKDSITQTYHNVKKYLKEIGFATPVIQPVSAQAGFLSKAKLNNEKLSEYEEEDLEFQLQKFKCDFYDLSFYNFFEHQKEKNVHKELWIRSGIENLEIMIARKEI